MRYELMNNNQEIKNISSVKTIGICYFEQICYNTALNSYQLDIIINNDTFYEF